MIYFHEEELKKFILSDATDAASRLLAESHLSLTFFRNQWSPKATKQTGDNNELSA